MPNAKDKSPDFDMVSAFRDLATPNVSDALDRLGIKGQVNGILPLWHGCPKIVGPAKTIKLSTEGDYSTAIGTLEAIEAGNKGDILVIDNGGLTTVNSFGGIASFSARHLGFAGCIIDGATRDVDEMAQLEFPVYARGRVVTSVRGRTAFIGHSIPVMIGDVCVEPGDMIFADDNGVVIIPNTQVEEVAYLAQSISQREQEICKDIAQGISPAEAHQKRQYDDWTRLTSD